MLKAQAQKVICGHTSDRLIIIPQLARFGWKVGGTAHDDRGQFHILDFLCSRLMRDDTIGLPGQHVRQTLLQMRLAEVGRWFLIEDPWAMDVGIFDDSAEDAALIFTPRWDQQYHFSHVLHLDVFLLLMF
jgi:hypothetical protein